MSDIEVEEEKSTKKSIKNDPRRTFSIESLFENFLWASRFLVILAVLSSLLASAILFLIGTYDIVKLVVDMVRAVLFHGTAVDLHGEAISIIVGSIDTFLIAVVSLIFSFGLYELFISHIDAADESESSTILEIASLDVLKEKIGQVIIMALIVKFFQFILCLKITVITDMLYFAVCVCILSLGLFLMHLGKKMSH